MQKTGDEREGALLRLLRDRPARGGRAGGFGFTTGAETAEKKRAMGVVARVAAGPDVVEAMREVASTSPDGIEFALEPGTDPAEVTKAIAAAGIPCGVYVEGAGDAVLVDQIEGLDWVHLAAAAPASLLAGAKDGPTRLVEVSPDAPVGRLPGLAGLKADVVVVDRPAGASAGAGAGASGLSLDTLLALLTIGGAAKGPTLVGEGLGLTPADAQVLHDHGVEGVLLAGGPAAARAFIAAIDGLDTK